MPRFLNLGVLFGLLLLMGVAHAGISPDYKMFLLTENGPPTNMAKDLKKNFARDQDIEGTATDAVREMFKRAGIKYDLTLRYPWDRMLNLVRTTPNTGIFSTSLTDERKPHFKWIGPLGGVSTVLVSAPGKNIKVADLNDIARYRVGAYKGDGGADFLDSQGLHYESALSDQSNLDKLLSGQIDLWATYDPVFRWYAKQKGVHGLSVAYVIDRTSDYLAVNPDTPDEVVQRLQKVLDEMRKDGTLQRLAEPYLSD